MMKDNDQIRIKKKARASSPHRTIYSIYNIGHFEVINYIIVLPYAVDGISCSVWIWCSCFLFYSNLIIVFHYLCKFQGLRLSKCGRGNLYISGKEYYASAFILGFVFYLNHTGRWRIYSCLQYNIFHPDWSRFEVCKNSLCCRLLFCTEK